MPMTPTTRRSDLAVAAKLFRGLADPSRLDILQSLSVREMRVTDLVSALGSSQANTSGHLACLRECGLVEGRPEGRSVFYSLANSGLFDLLSAAEGVLAASGQRIALCPNYGGAGSRRRRK